MYKGRKFKLVSYLGGDSSAGYGAKIGDIITLCDAPAIGDFADKAIWAKTSENDCFTDPRWSEYTYLCIVNDPDELAEHFEEVSVE